MNRAKSSSVLEALLELSALAEHIKSLSLEKANEERTKCRKAEYVCALDASGWNLYKNKKGAKAAAKDLNNVLTKEVNTIKKMKNPNYLYHAEKIRDRMYKLITKYKNYENLESYGSGPESVVVDQLHKAFGLSEQEFDIWSFS